LNHTNMSFALSSAFTWHDGFPLGFAPMDDIHEEFVDLVAALARAADDAVVPAIDALVDHARRHFGEEERWMAATEFPARACHADEHAAVLCSIEGVRNRVAKGGHQAARRLADALAEWFPGHADYMDAALAHWICKQRFGGKPLVMRRRIEALAPVIELT
jgi:hemerythrin